MRAKDIMRRRVITVTPDMTLRELTQLFIDRRISGAPVLSREGHAVGVISQTDLVRHERESFPREIPVYHRETEESARSRGFHIEVPDYARVKEAMTPSVIAFEEDTPVRELAERMLSKHIHRVVITRDGKLCGIVTSMDMLRALLTMIRKPKPAARV